MKIEIIIIALFVSVTVNSNAQNSKGGIDNGVKQRNINDIVNDTFYYLRNDTVFKDVYYASDKKIKTLAVYKKQNSLWVNINSKGMLVEVGSFVRKRYGTKYLFRKKAYKEVRKTGRWKYYNGDGNIVKEIDYK